MSKRGLDYYEGMVDGLLERGIAPMMTNHWDLPEALQLLGGWPSRETDGRYGEYAAVLAKRVGDRVAYWNTIDEPWCVAFVGHRDGLHAPGLKDPVAALATVHHQLLAHATGNEVLGAASVCGQIGLAMNLVSEVPASDTSEDREAAWLADGIENRMLLDPLFKGSYPEDLVEYYRDISDFGFVRSGDLDRISKPFDFFGVNFYEQHVTRYANGRPDNIAFDHPGERRTAMGIGVNASGLRDVLNRVRRDYSQFPIVITENGKVACDYVGTDGRINDQDRIAYWDEHLAAVREAIADGVDVRGYVAWSFLDNYEWQASFSRRYGMIFVYYGSQVRIWKESGYWYRDVIRSNGGTIGNAFRPVAPPFGVLLTPMPA